MKMLMCIIIAFLGGELLSDAFVIENAFRAGLGLIVISLALFYAGFLTGGIK